MDWQSLLDRAREIAETFWRPALIGLGVLIGGWIVARLLRLVLRRILARFGVDEKMSSLVATLCYVGLLIVVVIGAVRASGIAVDAVIPRVAPVLAAIGVLAVGLLGARVARTLVRRMLEKTHVDPTIGGFVANLGYIALIVIVVIAALGQAGISTAPFVAVVGAAGLAVGFALQGSLSNFAAGVMIIFFRPFRVGDVIEGGGASGVVEEIQVFATLLKTPDNKRIIVPNSALTAGNIINYSANPHRRVDLVFGIGYEDDMTKAKGIVAEILAQHPLVLKEPAAEVVVGQLADSSVNLYARPWVKTADYWAAYFDLTESIKRAFDKQGITIPFPQRDVHLHQVA